jgi:ABC-type nickel/cobalt efflux system permease component RcnA/Tol biopolymer transport system component
MPFPNRKRRLAWLARSAGVFLLLAFLPADKVQAHSLDMYAQTQTIDLTASGMEVDWKITPGPLLALGAWEQADQNHDGQISPQEARTWLMPFLTQWTLTMDGQPVGNIQVAGIHWPSSEDILQAGTDPIEIHLAIPWPQGVSGSHSLEIHNANQEAISLNWFSLAAAGGMSFSSPTQSNGRLAIRLNFGGSGTGNGALTSWDSGQPDLAGVTGAVSNLANNLSGSPAASPSAASTLSGPTAALVGLVRTGNLSLLFLTGAFFLSLILGSLHALTPGHGKTLVAAYLVGSHGKVGDAVFLGSVVTITHTGSVLIFGLVALLASRYIFPSLITPWLEVISGLAVVGFGLSLLVSRGRALYTWYESERSQKVARHFQGLRQAVSAGRPISTEDAARHRNAAVAHQHGDLVHTHPHVRQHSHSELDGEHDPLHSQSHSHTLDPDPITWKSLLTLGVSGGMVPCPDAIAILVVAVALGRIPLGMLLIVAFSLGLALVLIGIGVAMVQGMRFIKRNELMNRFSLYTPVLSAVVVLGLGLGLSFTAFHSLQLSSTALAGNPSTASNTTIGAGNLGQGFDIQKAHLIYLSQNNQGADQLTVLSLAGSASLVLTQEPTGVNGFSVSPDGKTILYSVLHLDGSSAIWAINLDGTGKRQVLACPQAQCNSPVWNPVGQKAVYARHDDNQISPSPMFSIWWLDLASGNTQPVFPDPDFPANAPAFSPDGRWLSYISPATNMVQIDNLQKSQTLSFPLSNQSFAEQLWSPTGDSILFWQPVSPQTGAAVHINRYILASSQKIDLGGTDQQADYEAAWSPDGQWIAINRDAPTGSASGPEQEIWLVHPDGSGGHPLLQEQGSYSNLSWSPDSRTLIYVQYTLQGGEKPEIWLTDVHTGKTSRILSGGVSPLLVP